MEKIIAALIFMVIFRLVPELLKRQRAKNNETHPLPKPIVIERETVSPKNTAVLHHDRRLAELPSAAAATPVQSVPSIREEASPWNDKLEQNMLINGVIFAEILQPPRAYRPFGKK